jgi:hypothetical protein
MKLYHQRPLKSRRPPSRRGKEFTQTGPRRHQANVIFCDDHVIQISRLGQLQAKNHNWNY